MKFTIVVSLLSFFKPLQGIQKSCVDVQYYGDIWYNVLDKVNVSACQNVNICNNTFSVSFVKQLVAYNYGNPIYAMIQRCCGSCAKIVHERDFTNITEITASSMNSSQFIFPILGKANAVKLYGYYFLPYVDAPGTIYITRKERVISLSNIFKLYPLIIISFLMAMISGFFAWIIETWQNEAEFSRPFLIGWFEGFWWSFVSMTTVGFGDKTPKSVTGRLFAIIWILVGLVCCGMLTGMLVSDIWKSSHPPPPDMKGEKVGLTRYNDYEGYVIAKHGGYAVEVDGSDFNSTMLNLIEKLRNRDIKGFLLDKYSLWHLNWMEKPDQHDSRHNQALINFFLRETMRTEKKYVGPKLSYGALVKHKEHYDYFLSYMEDNHFSRERKAAEFWIKEMKNTSIYAAESFYTSTDLLFSPHGGYFQSSLIAMCSMIASICVFGIIYEIRRKKEDVYSQGTESTECTISIL